MTCILKAAILIASLTACAPAALAERPAATISVSVSYSDLDLSRPAGAETLMKRINKASRKICGRRPIGAMLIVARRYNTCRVDVLSRAVRSVDAPTLTALYQGKIEPAIHIAAR